MARSQTPDDMYFLLNLRDPQPNLRIIPVLGMDSRVRENDTLVSTYFLNG